MYCTNCGAHLGEKYDTHCPRCAHPISSQRKRSPEPDADSWNEKSSETNMRSKRPLLMISAGLLCVVLVVWYLFSSGFFHDKGADLSAADPSQTVDAVFYHHVKVDVDENSIDNGRANVLVTLPDLVKIVDTVMSEKPDVSEAEFIKEVSARMDRHVVEKQFTLEVTKNNGHWEPSSPEEIDRVLHETLDDFLLHYLLQMETEANP